MIKSTVPESSFRVNKQDVGLRNAIPAVSAAFASNSPPQTLGQRLALYQFQPTPVAGLQRQLASGTAQLEFEPVHGYY
jgi:hypothetical protein